MAHSSLDSVLRTTSISSHAAVANQVFRFGKNPQPHGDPVASPKPTPRFIPPVSKQQPAPAFFYNLGDVIYFNGLSTLYPTEFYEPYQDYHAAISR